MSAASGSELTPAAAARAVLAAVEAGSGVAQIVVLEGASDVVRPGRRLVVTADRMLGTLGQGRLDQAARRLALRALRGDEVEEGTHTIPTSDEADRVRVYLELHHPQPDLVVVGAGHIARPLCAIGAMLGFRVIVLDDRPDFATRERFPEAEATVQVDFAAPFADVRIHGQTHVVLVTRGHKYDYECLRRLLRADPQPAYIGMIGSRRRVRATYAQLLEEGISRERVAEIRAPVGLALGAQTPAEIAVAVAAEIVLLWRGGSGRPLREEERVLERFFPGGDTEETDG